MVLMMISHLVGGVVPALQVVVFARCLELVGLCLPVDFAESKMHQRNLFADVGEEHGRDKLRTDTEGHNAICQMSEQCSLSKASSMHGQRRPFMERQPPCGLDATDEGQRAHHDRFRRGVHRASRGVRSKRGSPRKSGRGQTS